MYRMAAGVSLNGYVRSTTGVTLPASMSPASTIRSSPFSDEANMPSFWPTNGDSSGAWTPNRWNRLEDGHAPAGDLGP